MTSAGTNDVQAGGRIDVRKAARAYGLLLLVLGFIGFIPGPVRHYDYLAAGDHIAGWLLLDTFQVSPLHNALHLLIGCAGLLLAGSVRGAWHFLLCGGFVYLALCIFGRVTSKFRLMPLNNADDWLHLFLGATMIGLALLLARGCGRTAARGASHDA